MSCFDLLTLLALPASTHARGAGALVPATCCSELALVSLGCYPKASAGPEPSATRGQHSPHSIHISTAPAVCLLVCRQLLGMSRDDMTSQLRVQFACLCAGSCWA